MRYLQADLHVYHQARRVSSSLSSPSADPSRRANRELPTDPLDPFYSLTQHSDSKHKGAPIATLFPTFVAK